MIDIDPHGDLIPEHRHKARSRPGILNAPQPIQVEVHPNGEPKSLNRELVEFIREEWRVVDRWWTDRPIKRRYFEVFLQTSGRRVVIFWDATNRRWFRQNG
jgi:hypothetical protein